MKKRAISSVFLLRGAGERLRGASECAADAAPAAAARALGHLPKGTQSAVSFQSRFSFIHAFTTHVRLGLLCYGGEIVITEVPWPLLVTEKGWWLEGIGDS